VSAALAESLVRIQRTAVAILTAISDDTVADREESKATD
jgi:hypothetical protein